MIRFNGDLQTLKERVRRCKVRGKWRHISKSNQHQFQAETGEHMNWWPTTGTITFQGGDAPVLRDRYELRNLPREVRRAAGVHG